MYDDDILRGVREARDAIARSYGYDMHAMVAGLKAMDDAEGTPTVRLEPRRPAGWVDPATASGSDPEPLTVEFVERLHRDAAPVSLSVNGRGKLVVGDAESYRLLIELVERLETRASAPAGSSR